MKLEYYKKLMTIGFMANAMDLKVNFLQILLLNFLMIYKNLNVILKGKHTNVFTKIISIFFFFS